MSGEVAWPLALALASLGWLVGGWLGARLRRVERAAEHAESERAWSEFSRQLGIPFGAAASRAWAKGEEFYCRCGRREVVAKGEPPPTCQGVSCVGLEHPTRVMHGVTGP